MVVEEIGFIVVTVDKEVLVFLCEDVVRGENDVVEVQNRVLSAFLFVVFVVEDSLFCEMTFYFVDPLGKNREGQDN